MIVLKDEFTNKTMSSGYISEIKGYRVVYELAQPTIDDLQYMDAKLTYKRIAKVGDAEVYCKVGVEFISTNNIDVRCDDITQKCVYYDDTPLVETCYNSMPSIENVTEQILSSINTRKVRDLIRYRGAVYNAAKALLEMARDDEFSQGQFLTVE